MIIVAYFKMCLISLSLLSYDIYPILDQKNTGPQFQKDCSDSSIFTQVPDLT